MMLRELTPTGFEIACGLSEYVKNATGVALVEVRYTYDGIHDQYTFRVENPCADKSRGALILTVSGSSLLCSLPDLFADWGKDLDAFCGVEPCCSELEGG